jgi:Protein involved in cell division
MNDPYLYPNSETLINKFDVTESDMLDEMEAEYTSIRLKELVINPIDGDFDFEHFCNIHHYIFQDIYDWAGKPRTINIEKSEPALGGLSIEYADYLEISKLSYTVLSKLHAVQWTNMTMQEKAKAISKSMSELWQIHAFREGNTRSVITFICDFAEREGFPLNRKLFKDHSQYVRTSLVASCATFKDIGDKSQPEYLIRIVYDAITQ